MRTADVNLKSLVQALHPGADVRIVQCDARDGEKIPGTYNILIGGVMWVRLIVEPDA